MLTTFSATASIHVNTVSSKNDIRRASPTDLQVSVSRNWMHAVHVPPLCQTWTRVGPTMNTARALLTPCVARKVPELCVSPRRAVVIFNRHSRGSLAWLNA